MLYHSNVLRNLSGEDDVTAIKRYFHKINKGETGKLCPHECEFIALRFRHIYKDDDNTDNPVLAIDPYDQHFLSEAVFKYLVLIYFENLDFLRPVLGATREMSYEEILRDKKKFYELLQHWQIRLRSNKNDRFLHEVKLEYLRKLAIIKRQKLNGLLGYHMYLRKCLEQELLAFYIYFTVKSYFKNLQTTYIQTQAYGQRFVVNIYSYVHILSRHYIPKFNGIDTEKTFNNSLSFIDPFNLPSSLIQIVDDYFQHVPQNFILNQEYMLFAYQRQRYIIWWKLKTIQEINNEISYEIRTLYRVHRLNDLAKFNNTTLFERVDGVQFHY
jgi:hypothetical protein